MRLMAYILGFLGLITAMWGWNDISTTYRAAQMKIALQGDLLEMYRNDAAADQISRFEESVSSLMTSRDTDKLFMPRLWALVGGIALFGWSKEILAKIKRQEKLAIEMATRDL